MSLRDLAIMTGVCLVWAANSVLSKVLIAHYGVPPLFYAAVRFGLIVLATARWLFPVPRPVWRMVAVGLTMGGGTMALSFMSLKTVSASAFAVVSQLGVPMATLMSVAWLGERIGLRRGVGVALTLAGAFIVMWNPAGLVPSPGMLLVAASALCGALGAVLMKQMETARPRQFQAWVGFSSAFPLAGLTALTETGQGAVLSHAFWPFALGVTFSALVVSVVAHTAFYGLIQKYEVNLVQPLTLMTPLATIGLGVIVTHDPFDGRMIAGAAIALIGVMTVALRPEHIAAPMALLRGGRA